MDDKQLERAWEVEARIRDKFHFSTFFFYRVEKISQTYMKPNKLENLVE